MGRVEKLLFAWLVAMLLATSATAAYVVAERVTRCSPVGVDAVGWRIPHAHRNELAHRLVQCHALDGLTRGELQARLGRPTARHARAWTYDSGVQPSFMFPTPQTLEVELSKDNVVRRASIQSADD
jgi:hypothetical protein